MYLLFLFIKVSFLFVIAENAEHSLFNRSKTDTGLQISFSTGNYDATCVKDVNLIFASLKIDKLRTWRVFDAFLKPPLEILNGELYQLGNFDECVDLKYRKVDERIIQGQYCLVDLIFGQKSNGDVFHARDSPNKRSKFRDIIHWGICVPSSCTHHEVREIVKEILSSILYIEVNIAIDKKSCYIEKNEPASTGEIIYGCIVALFIVFIIFSTTLHIIHVKGRIKRAVYNVETVRSQNVSVKNEIVFSFSLIQTVGKLLHTKPSELNLECICGIKFLSMMLIITGHSLIFVFGGPISNTDFFEQNSHQLQNGLFLNNPLLVDSFLLISGFLMCYLLLIELQKRNGKINLLLLYTARYIRLTPAYLIVIGFYITWLPKIGSGPLWRRIVETENERCIKSWWANLLYVNNYVQTDHLCMFQAWYLAADYHLFIIAPFIIYSLWKWKILGKLILGILIIKAALLSLFLTITNHLDPTLLAFPPEIEDISTNFYFVNAYIKTHMRAISYLLGIVLGYIIHRIQIQALKIPKVIQIIAWPITILLGTGSMFSIITFYQPNYEYNDIESGLYTGLHRIAWCIFVGWVITSCITENSPIVNKFLGWKIFIPLSRLTYCAYLANGIIEIFHKATTRQPLTLSKFELACRLLGHLVLTFSLAFVLCICFESPIHCLEKILLRRSPVEKVRIPSNIFKISEDNYLRNG